MHITHTASVMFLPFPCVHRGGGGGGGAPGICTIWLMSQGMSTFWLRTLPPPLPPGNEHVFACVRYAIDIRIALLSMKSFMSMTLILHLMKYTMHTVQTLLPITPQNHFPHTQHRSLYNHSNRLSTKQAYHGRTHL